MEAIAQKQVVKAILLINPSNPLGDIYSADLLQEIFSFSHEYVTNHISLSSSLFFIMILLHIPNMDVYLERIKLTFFYGISKDFSIAGLRIGAIHTECKPLQNCLKQLSIFQNIPYPVMDIAAKFVEDLDWCKRYLFINQQRLSEKFKQTADRARKMGLNVRESEAGFFLWLDFRPICGSESFAQERDFFLYLMEKARLYIVPGEELFCAQPGWFRLSFSSNPDHVDEGNIFDVIEEKEIQC
ncbi:1-aminocyclopropane-1-carboxylate synthase-like protein 1 [Caerostris extrusa]|uniref:1-aminocyclopropane-1-carboxylate synthase-like protein 1 n=1 Tax=Caerostris extrusa TaxID=172846 RepID=A0AAV4Y0M6_CAEEX|nr:1-aminocyclopropane-1-carboxylate synthase-like protein 1 [Caerostris extrusa]